MWTCPVKTADSETAIKCLEKFMFSYGVPDAFTTDSASYFTGFAFQQALEKWDIFHNSFRKIPHCNGAVERSVKSLKEFLAQFLLQFQGDWDIYLPLVTMVYNLNHHSAIGCSPFYAVHAFVPRIPGIHQLLPQTATTLENKIDTHKQLFRKIKSSITKAQENNKKFYDANRKEVTYKNGDLVKVRVEDEELGYPEKRVKFRGPFKIVGKRSSRFYFVAVEVRLPGGGTELTVKEFHVQNIRPFKVRDKDLSFSDDEPPTDTTPAIRQQ